MNVSEKRALERMIDQRADQALRERTMPPPPEPPTQLVQRVQAAHDAAKAKGWSVYVNHGSEAVSFSPATGNPIARANRKADEVIVAAVAAAKDAAIIELWTSDEFDLAAVFASLDQAKS
jgi:hypothetical protein